MTCSDPRRSGLGLKKHQYGDGGESTGLIRMVHSGRLTQSEKVRKTLLTILQKDTGLRFVTSASPASIVRNLGVFSSSSSGVHHFGGALYSWGKKISQHFANMSCYFVLLKRNQELPLIFLFPCSRLYISARIG